MRLHKLRIHTTHKQTTHDWCTIFMRTYIIIILIEIQDVHSILLLVLVPRMSWLHWTRCLTHKLQHDFHPVCVPPSDKWSQELVQPQVTHKSLSQRCLWAWGTKWIPHFLVGLVIPGTWLMMRRFSPQALSNATCRTWWCCLSQCREKECARSCCTWPN